MRLGKCLQCGKCCQTKFLLKGMKLTTRILLYIITLLKGRRARKTDKCGFLEFKDGKAYCKNYEGRPDFCRAFPVDPGDYIEGCGFTIL